MESNTPEASQNPQKIDGTLRGQLYGTCHTIRFSKIQKCIFSLLAGTERPLVYGNPRGGLVTNELFEELEARGLVKAQRRKLAMFTVRRAALALYRRKLLSAEYRFDCNNPGRRTISFKANPEQQKEAA